MQRLKTKMKKLLVIVLLLNVVFANAQTDEEKLTSTLKEFHQSLVKKNTVSINQQTDKALSYGHSNGWVETKTEMIKNLETGYISYNSYKRRQRTGSNKWKYGECKICRRYERTLNGEIGNLSFKSAGSVGEERKEMVVVCETGGEMMLQEISKEELRKYYALIMGWFVAKSRNRE